MPPTTAGKITGWVCFLTRYFFDNLVKTSAGHFALLKPLIKGYYSAIKVA